MRVKSSWRSYLHGLLLCLPAAMLTVAIGYFLYDKMPDIVRNERWRVFQAYRERTVEAKEAGRGEPFDFAASGLKKTDFRIHKELWGYTRDSIWYFDGAVARRLAVDPIEPVDFGLLFSVFAGAVIVVSWLLTLFGLRYFFKFIQSRDDFLAATAHDLTTPLVGLRLLVGRDAEAARQLVERLLLIVSNIKHFLALGGRPRPEPKPFDLLALSREAYRLFAADYEDSESGAVAFPPADETCPVTADPTLTMQILWNLFGNDLKYAAPFGPVRVACRRAGGFAEWSLVDEGPGMNAAARRRAFDRYYRAQTVLVSGKGGFGIGLCTAREFARAMGGDLTVEANTPRGCVFRLLLPRCRPDV